MSVQCEQMSFSMQIAKLASDFDEQIGMIIESSTGKTLEFHIGRILESLLDSGLDFCQALEVIRQIEDKLQPGMETRDISSAIIAELDQLDRNWARDFRTKYDEGITINVGNSDKVPLRMAELRDISRAKAADIGYSWGNRRQLDDVTRSLIIRCRKLCISEIPFGLLDQLFEQELTERLGGHTIYEYQDEMPSVVSSAVERITNLVDKDEIEDYDDLLRQVHRVCRAVLFHFDVIPPIEVSECLNTAVTLFDRAQKPGTSLRIALTDFSTIARTHSKVVDLLEGKRPSVDFLIGEVKATLRRLSFLTSGQASCEAELDDRVMESWDQMRTTVLFLAEFSAFLWPEDWLAASTLRRLRHEVLRSLFRYRVLGMDKLTRMLQVHPKHTLRALVQLRRDGLAVTHRLRDGELILITPEGEQYCGENLGLKLRCSLSSL